MVKFPKGQESLKELSKYVIAEPYPFVIDLQKSKGMYLATTDGQMIFDWAGYFGSKLIAHNYEKMYTPEVQEKLLCAAVNKTANPDFLTEECLDYYRLLYRLAPEVMKNDNLEVYAVNSGAEAVENVMKYLLNRYNQRRLAAGKEENINRRFIYFDESFHGRTIYALGVTELTHDTIMIKDTRGLYPGRNIKIPFPYYVDGDEEGNRRRVEESLALTKEIFEKHAEEIVAVIAEPIQGAGGQRATPDGYFASLSQLCHDYGVQLAFDEVQTAGGQTGAVFMVDQLNLPYPPDAIATGKKFGNGIIYMLEAMDDVGILDSTWGGTLVDMVRVVEEFKIVEEEGLIAKVPEKGAHLQEILRRLCEKYPTIMTNVRGAGLYLGFTVLNGRRNELTEIALEHEDLLLLGAGKDSIRTRPHLHVTHADIAIFGEKLDRSLARLS